MKKSFKLSLASLLVSVATFGLVAAIMHNAYSVKETKAWSGEQTPNIGNYYSSISDSLTGSALQSALKQKNDSLSKSPSYDWSRYEAADETEGDSSTIWCVYTRHAIPKSGHCGSYSWTTWNREHVWTQSAYPASDKDNHNIYACEGQINNYRGNLPYAEVDHTSSTRQVVFGHQTDCYIQNGKFEPCDEAKGEIARAVMYGVVMYNYTMTNMISYETVLKWNLEHPVTNRDIYRNNIVQNLQGNRNPFIDHPEYACKIWGDTNSTTRSICNSTTPVTPKTLESIDVRLSDESSTSSGISVDVNSYQQLKVYAVYDDDSRTDITSSATYTTTVNSTNYSSYISLTGGKLTGLQQTNYAAFSVSYNGKSTTRTVYVTAEGTGNGTPVGGGGSGSSSDATYTVSTVSTVTTSGTTPTGSTATYSQTYAATAGQITGDNNAVLTLSGYSGKIITGITLNMHSNASKGSGGLSVVAGSTTLASLSSGTAFNKWYDNTSYGTSFRDVNVDLTNSNYEIKNNEDVTITISASANSLYINSYTISYSDATPTPAKELESISISNEKTEYTVGDTFVKPTVTATYSDGSTANVTNSATFSGYDMSKEDVYTVEVEYSEGGVDAYTEYDIIVTASEATSITATVNKNFYVGETISKSDITVKDNLNNTITDYTFESYQYTYADAASGGALTNKNFTIAYSGLTTTLNTKVQRKAHVTPSPSTSVTDTLDRAKTGIASGSTNYDSWSEKTDHSSAVYAGQSAGDKDSIQLRSKNSNSGIITTASGGTLSKVTVVWHNDTEDGRTLNVYGKQSSYDSPSDLYVEADQGTLLGTIVKGTSTELTISGDYAFVGVRSASGAMYLRSISFTWGGSGTSDSAVNLSNYVMFEDNGGQCVNKFPTAKGYFEGLSKAERNTFMTSNDYVIATARERLVAWAAYHGKTITNSGDDGYVINSNKLSITAQNNAVLLITIIGVVIISSLTATYLVSKKRKQD